MAVPLVAGRQPDGVAEGPAHKRKGRGRNKEKWPNSQIRMDALQLFLSKHCWVGLKMRTEERQYGTDLTSLGGCEIRPRVTRRNVDAAEGRQKCREQVTPR